MSVHFSARQQLTVLVHQRVLVDTLLDPARRHDVLAFRPEVSYADQTPSLQRRRLAHDRHVAPRVLVVHDDVRRVHQVCHDAPAVLFEHACDLIKAVCVSYRGSRQNLPLNRG